MYNMLHVSAQKIHHKALLLLLLLIFIICNVLALG